MGVNSGRTLAQPHTNGAVAAKGLDEISSVHGDMGSPKIADHQDLTDRKFNLFGSEVFNPDGH
jgi:hypothetical protein